MLDELSKYSAVLLSSMVKFLFGPLTGIATGLSFLETFLFTVIGMMASVVLFMFIGEKLRLFYFKYINRNYNPFSFRKKIKIWNNWGMKGVAFLTPVLLSPIGGTVIAVAFGESRKRIFTYMLISAIFWGITITFLVFKFGTFDFSNLLNRNS